jgi:hypothetical protein
MVKLSAFIGEKVIMLIPHTPWKAFVCLIIWLATAMACASLSLWMRFVRFVAAGRRPARWGALSRGNLSLVSCFCFSPFFQVLCIFLNEIYTLQSRDDDSTHHRVPIYIPHANTVVTMSIQASSRGQVATISFSCLHCKPTESARSPFRWPTGQQNPPKAWSQRAPLGRGSAGRWSTDVEQAGTVSV